MTIGLLIVDVDRRRVWVGGRRVHHGLVGAALVGAGLLVPSPVGPALLALGAALVFDDRHDVPWPLTRLPVR